MTFEKFVEGSPLFYDSTDIDIIRSICYEIHMLDICDSINYLSFNNYHSHTPIAWEIRGYLNKIEDGKWT